MQNETIQIKNGFVDELIEIVSFYGAAPQWLHFSRAIQNKQSKPQGKNAIQHRIPYQVNSACTIPNYNIISK